jgi:hypothetical protein
LDRTFEEDKGRFVDEAAVGVTERTDTDLAVFLRLATSPPVGAENSVRINAATSVVADQARGADALVEARAFLRLSLLRNALPRFRNVSF